MSPALLLFTSAFDQFHWLRGRVNPVRRRLVFLPKGGLGFVTIPGIFLACYVSVEHWLVLELVAPETPGEGVLGPNDLATYLEAGCFQRVLKLSLP